jgi:hypothetical protein
MTETMLGKMWGTTQGQIRKLEENGGFSVIAMPTGDRCRLD